MYSGSSDVESEDDPDAAAKGKQTPKKTPSRSQLQTKPAQAQTQAPAHRKSTTINNKPQTSKSKPRLKQPPSVPTQKKARAPKHSKQMPTPPKKATAKTLQGRAAPEIPTTNKHEPGLAGLQGNTLATKQTVQQRKSQMTAQPCQGQTYPDSTRSTESTKDQGIVPTGLMSPSPEQGTEATSPI